MQCKKCGKNNSDNNKFCTQCGEKLTVNHENKHALEEMNHHALQNHHEDTEKKNVVPIILAISAVTLIIVVSLVIVFMQSDKSHPTPEKENQNVLTSSDSQAITPTKEPVTTEKPESTEEVTETVTSDDELIDALKDKYGTATVEYTGDSITVDRDGEIRCPLGFQAAEKNIEDWSAYFTVYQDTEMKYPMSSYAICDYDTNTLIIPPPGDGVAELSTYGSDVDLSDLKGNYLSDEERGDSWGNFGELYLVQKLDMETGEELEIPRITIIQVNTELKEAPVVQYMCDEKGVATINWTPVEGATDYILFFITKWEGEGYTEGFDNTMTAFARTSDTSWSAMPYEYKDTTLFMNQFFSNYITSEASAAGGMEEQHEDYRETMMKYLGVIAVTENGCSPVSNLCSLSSYAEILPQSWAYNQNNAEIDTSGITIDLLPAEMSITMCDGTTSRRVLEYDVDNYEIDENGQLNIIARGSGTLLEQKFKVDIKDETTLKADLKTLQERQEKLKNKGGVIEKGIEIKSERTEPLKGIKKIFLQPFSILHGITIERAKKHYI